jgi:hypothetical protein
MQSLSTLHDVSKLERSVSAQTFALPELDPPPLDDDPPLPLLPEDPPPDDLSTDDPPLPEPSGLGAIVPPHATTADDSNDATTIARMLELVMQSSEQRTCPRSECESPVK